MKPIVNPTMLETPFRDQLERGYDGLRFEPDLERDFVEDLTRRSLGRTRIALAIGVFMILATTLLDIVFREPEFARRAALLRTCFMLLPIAVMLAATWSERGQRLLQPLGALVGISLGLSSLAIGALGAQLGLPGYFSGYLVATFYIYFLLGLRFLPAVATAGTVLVSYFVFMIAAGQPAEPIAYNGLFLAFANVVGATGLHALEHNQRTSYLRESLLGLQAGRDGLTGLGNRRAFEEEHERSWAQAFRDQKPLSILLIDIDHFKAFNDLYGHQAGDRCLVRVAQVLGTAARRPRDFVGRYGGEEFVVLLPGATAGYVEHVAEKLRVEVEALGIDHSSSPAETVTVSIGTAMTVPHEDVRSADGLLQLADEALYAAKTAGRNRVVHTSPQKHENFTTGLFRARA